MNIGFASAVDARYSHFNQVGGDQNNFFVHNNYTYPIPVLEALNQASVPEAQYNFFTRDTPPCHPGTRTDILSKLSIWSSAVDAPPICQLLGYAGHGKTAIARSLAYLCAARPFDSPHSLAATFFFHRDDTRRHTIRHVVPTLIRQFSVAVPELVPILQNIIQRDPSVVDSAFEDQVQRLILDPLRTLPLSKTPRLILFDALDECEDAKAILHLISLLVDPGSNPNFPLRVFITSRPEPAICVLFKSIQMPIYPLDLCNFSSNDDIRLFLQHSLQDIRHSRSGVMGDLPSLWPSKAELDDLVVVASGMFIFATTAATFIGDGQHVPQAQLLTILRMRGYSESQWAPGEAELDRLYKQVLSSSPDKPELLLVLSAIMFLEVPLSLRQFEHLLGLPLGHVQLALEGLHSVLSIPDNPDQGSVSPLHLSFNDFLTSHHRAGEYFIDPRSAHTAISRACLALISRDVPRYRPIFQSQNTGDPTSIIQTIEQLVQPREDAKTIAVRYACNYFTTHLTHSEDGNVNLQSDLSQFCRDQVIPWQIFLAMDAGSIQAKCFTSSYAIILFSMQQLLGPLCFLAWIITSVVLPFIDLDIARQSRMIDQAVITASVVELVFTTAHLPRAVWLTLLALLAYLSSTTTFHLYAWWAPMHVVFVAARLRSTWRPAIVLLWFLAVLSSSSPGTPSLPLEHQVPRVTILFSVMAEYRQLWGEWCIVLYSLRMGHRAMAYLSLASIVQKIAVALVFALSLGRSWTWNLVQVWLLLDIVTEFRRKAWKRITTLCSLMIVTAVISTPACRKGVTLASALSLGLSFPWMFVLESDVFWTCFVLGSWFVLFLALGPFLGVSGCLITGVVAGFRAEQLSHRMGLGRDFRQQKGRLSIFEMGYARSLPPDKLRSVNFGMACIGLSVLLIVLYGVFGVALRVVGEVDMVWIHAMLLGYVVPPLAVAVYLEDLWVLWKPRCGYMNKMDLLSRFVYLEQMRYLWWLKIRKHGDGKDC